MRHNSSKSKGPASSVSRRSFLKKSAIGCAGALLSACSTLPGTKDGDETNVTILHTNDLHSRIDPYPDTHSKYPGMGGFSKISTMIRQTREENPNTIAVDAGDLIQGTPYFNIFRGELEFKLLDKMGYDFMTLGNHDFDAGVEKLAENLRGKGYGVLNCNYEITHKELRKRIKPWAIRSIGDVKIGFLGLGVRFNELVLPDLHNGFSYRDPVASAKEAVAELKNECDTIIAISHLGVRSGKGHANDNEIAEQVDEIDFIIGGHSHKILDPPLEISRASLRKCWIMQTGAYSLNIGKLDLRFRNKKLISVRSSTLPLDGKAS